MTEQNGVSKVSALGFRFSLQVDIVDSCLCDNGYILSSDQWSPIWNDCPSEGSKPRGSFVLFPLCTVYRSLNPLFDQIRADGKDQWLKVLWWRAFYTSPAFCRRWSICVKAIDQARELKLIIFQYGKATRQSVNLEKSAIFFGSKIEE